MSTDRVQSDAPGIILEGVAFAYGDITEPDCLPKAMEGVEGVLHLAAWYEFGIDDREKMRRINVDGTRSVLEAALEAGSQRNLYCSSIVAMGMTGSQPANESHLHPGT